jgi:hypothetical protein
MEDMAKRYPRTRDGLFLIVLGALMWLGCVPWVLLEDPGQPWAWVFVSVVSAFTGGIIVLGVAALPHRQADALLERSQPDGPVVIVGIRESKGVWAGLVGIWVGPVAMVVYFLVDLVTHGYNRGGTEGALVFTAIVLSGLVAAPALIRAYRSRSTVGWILEQRGIALPRGPGVTSIPWPAVIGVDISEFTMHLKGRSRVLPCLVIRTDEPHRFARASDLRRLHQQVGYDATAVVGVPRLRSHPHVVIAGLEALLKSPDGRQALGTTSGFIDQVCAPFASECL